MFGERKYEFEYSAFFPLLHLTFTFPLYFQFGGVLAVVVSKEKRGLALAEFANVQAAVSILALPVFNVLIAPPEQTCRW